MNLVEASRQYQDALEYDRRTRGEYEDVVSADDIREESSAVLEDARKALSAAWEQHVIEEFRQQLDEETW